MPVELQPCSKTAEKFVVRLPLGMRSRIADHARANVRSMNSEILYRLARAEELESALERANLTIDRLLAASTVASQGGHES